MVGKVGKVHMQTLFNKGTLLHIYMIFHMEVQKLNFRHDPVT